MEMVFEYLNTTVQESLLQARDSSPEAFSKIAEPRPVEVLFSIIRNNDSSIDAGVAWIAIAGYWHRKHYHEAISQQLSTLLMDKCGITAIASTYVIPLWQDFLCSMIDDIRKGNPRFSSDPTRRAKAERNLIFETQTDFLDGFVDRDVMRRMGACLKCSSDADNARKFEKQLRVLSENDPEEVVKDIAKRALRHCSNGT